MDLAYGYLECGQLHSQSMRVLNRHLIPVNTSFDAFPSNASLNTTGYLPGLSTSIEAAAIASMISFDYVRLVRTAANKRLVLRLYVYMHSQRDETSYQITLTSPAFASG